MICCNHQQPLFQNNNYSRSYAHLQQYLCIFDAEDGYTPAMWMKDKRGMLETFEDKEDDLSDVKKKLFDG